jgi:hypothetical protein
MLSPYSPFGKVEHTSLFIAYLVHLEVLVVIRYTCTLYMCYNSKSTNYSTLYITHINTVPVNAYSGSMKSASPRGQALWELM